MMRKTLNVFLRKAREDAGTLPEVLIAELYFGFAEISVTSNASRWQ